MADYRDYVSFDPPSHVVENVGAEAAAQFRVTGRDREIMERALAEIASTPEGLDLLKKAASRGPDGKVNIMFDPGGYSVAYAPNDFAIGTQDRSYQYYSTETRQYHNLSVQHLLVHELNHLALGHQEFKPENESQAVRETNKFMKKYYGEPNRDEDTTTGRMTGGTPELDLDTRFRRFSDDVRADYMPQQLMQNLSSIPDGKALHLSPELQSLHALKDHPQMFSQQVALLDHNGGLSAVMRDSESVASTLLTNMPETRIAARIQSPQVEIAALSPSPSKKTV